MESPLVLTLLALSFPHPIKISANVVNLIDSINNGQISSTITENTFSFTKVGNIWLPSDTTNYTESISKMVTK
ncbi:hypothetical protein [Clostridium beijerinckii]|uniref:Uncharacterized protein n=1 Tax=Clostridium beijerinckii TaxID=1520 RepID=A0A7X9XM97_CLOBE|nr:hypothetical protein [Clostridium beijerinckii]NMF03182.1 hypothetical protein [Clostridium beijerinckii]